MATQNPKVLVKEGWLEGALCDLVTGNGSYYSFKGIPYATPPIGNLRFKAPQPPKAWTGIRKAIDHGPVCPQYDYVAGQMALGSEDCLYLNVYTRTLNPDKPIPVMVFIHGGAYVWGSGNEDNYGPDFLVEQDVVLVTINYRLGALGFLCLDTKDVPGNAAMRDQVAALKWVQNNIQQFGGDPQNVTIFGESAGGLSVALHMMSPLSKGLFRRAILMSGIMDNDSLAHQPRKRAFALGKQLGLETDDPEVLLNFLQNVSVEKLVTTKINLDEYEEKTDGLFKVLNYAPVVEKKLGQEPFLSMLPDESLKKGAGADIDVMAGMTDEEAIFMMSLWKDNIMESYRKYPDLFLSKTLAFKVSNIKMLELSKKIRYHYFGDKEIDSKVKKEFVTFFNEYMNFIFCRFMNSLSNSGKSERYVYRFCCVSERNIYGAPGLKLGIKGAAHLDDTVYLFDPKRENLKLDPNSKSYEMVKLSCRVFTNFAKYGNPTPDTTLGVAWPQYSERAPWVMNIGEALTLRTHLDADACHFWKQIYDSAEAERTSKP